jgi:hypothetical protein
MKVNPTEFGFLSAWAREEKAVNPYVLPAHKLQAAHKVSGVVFIRAIKSWARTENREDEEIFNLFDVSDPPWPWTSPQEMSERLSGIAEEQHV